MSSSSPAPPPPSVSPKENPSSASDLFRKYVLPVAGILIAVLVIWRIRIDSGLPGPGAIPERGAMMAAPRSILTDQHRHMVKLEAYLGRTKLLIVFFDGTKPAHTDPIVARLLKDHAALLGQGVQPIAISAASPFAITKSEEISGKRFPFPVLMDVDPNGHTTYPAHRAWGLADNRSEELKTGVFVVDRAGLVPARGLLPRPVVDPEATIDAILRGNWPDAIEGAASPGESK